MIAYYFGLPLPDPTKPFTGANQGVLYGAFMHMDCSDPELLQRSIPFWRQAVASVPPVFATINAIAHHEAGHAVLAISTGIMEVYDPITYAAGSAATVPVKAAASRFRRFGMRGGTAAHYNDMMATVLAGGFAAEWRYHQDAWQIPNAKQMQLGAHGDLASIVSLFGSGHWNTFKAKADNVISNPVTWSAIQKLASVLLSTWPNPVPVAVVYAAVGHIDPGFPMLSL